MAFTIEFLSASNSGEPVVIAATSSPGTLIHTSIAGTSQKDEVFLYVNNTGSGVWPFILQMGGTGLANQMAIDIYPKEPPQLICQGFLVNNSATIRGYSPSGVSGLIINGYVQRGP
jgi:hypothetical protein